MTDSPGYRLGCDLEQGQSYTFSATAMKAAPMPKSCSSSMVRARSGSEVDGRL